MPSAETLPTVGRRLRLGEGRESEETGEGNEEAGKDAPRGRGPTGPGSIPRPA